MKPFRNVSRLGTVKSCTVLPSTVDQISRELAVVLFLGDVLPTMSNAESLPLPEATVPGVPGGEAEACVDEWAKAPSPALVHEENKDVGTDRKRENSPENERGDFKRLCATLETQLPSVLEKLHEGCKLTGEALKTVNENTGQIQRDLPELARGMADCWSEG